jgi:hypothetical protein
VTSGLPFVRQFERPKKCSKSIHIGSKRANKELLR